MINREQVEQIIIGEKSITVIFKDGKIGEDFFSSYPSLLNATLGERENYTESFYGLHWPSLDEDLSFEGFYKISH